MEMIEENKQFFGADFGEAMKVKMKHLEEFLVPPYIGLSLARGESGEKPEIVAHMDRELTQDEKSGEHNLEGFAVRYVADGINISRQKENSSLSR